MKYKLWCKYKKEFLEKGWVINPEGEVLWIEYGEIVCGSNMKNYVLLKNTGIKDIKGKEIYEGDILKCKLHNKKYENYLIVWNKEDAGFDALNKDKSNFMSPIIWNKFEVIGNIFPNPELL